MNSGNGMMRIGVTVPLISLIALFLVLNMFFGAWILALPLASAAAILIFFVGTNRLKSSVSSLTDARKNSVNLFGLPDLPRFYGFLHVLCWFIPPILFLIMWQIFGTAWMDAQRTMLNMEVVSFVVPKFHGLSIDVDGMNAATRALFSSYFLGTSIDPAYQQYAEGFTAAFDGKFIGRRWLWVALIASSVAVWHYAPQNYASPTAFAIALGALAILTLCLAFSAFFWLSIFSSVPLMIALVALGMRFFLGLMPPGKDIFRRLFVIGVAIFCLAIAAVVWLLMRDIQSVPGAVTQITEFSSPTVAVYFRVLALIAAVFIALFTLNFKLGLNPLMGRTMTVFGVVALLIYLNHITQFDRAHGIFPTLLFVFSLLALWLRGERMNLRSPPVIILLATLGVFVMATVVGLLEMYGWVQQFVATDFGRPSIGLIDTNGGKVDRLIAEIRNGVEVTPELLKDVRAKQAHFDAAYSWIQTTNQTSKFIYFSLLGAVVVGAALSVFYIRPSTKARTAHEHVASLLLIVASAIAILITIGLILALLSSAELFFSQVPAQEFLNELTWNKGGINDLVGADRKSKLGALPVFYGTMMVSIIALALAVPIGLFSAIFLSEYANATVRNIFKPILEILAGVPTIVYGVFALLIVGPWVRELWGDVGTPFTGYEMGGRSALIAGGVMGIMLIPFISSLSDDALKAVPRPLREGSLALGANRSETILKVLLPAALPGIMGGVLLATSRAIGETMIVVLAAGRAAKFSANPLEPMTTVTVQIVEFLTGDLALDTPEALSAFGLGLVLFLATLVLNMIAIVIVRRFRMKYS